MANQRFIILMLWMLLAYFLSYLSFAVVWHIVAEIDKKCVEGVIRHNFLATYLFSLETQVCCRQSLSFLPYNQSGKFHDS
jgi:hypothetical protein